MTSLKQIQATQEPAMPRLWLMALSLAITLEVAAALAIWHLRRVSFDARAQELGSLSLAVSDDIDRGLQGVQGGLYALRRELAEGFAPPASGQCDTGSAYPG